MKFKKKCWHRNFQFYEKGSIYHQLVNKVNIFKYYECCIKNPQLFCVLTTSWNLKNLDN